MQRRIAQQRWELVGVVRRSELGHPRPADRELVVAQHIHHAHGGNRRAEQLGSLGHRRADQQAAVAAAPDSQPVRGCVTVVDQPLGRGQEIVEDVLLVRLHPGLVPAASVLAAPAQIRHGVQSAALHPDQIADRKTRGQRNVEPAVAVQNGLPTARRTRAAAVRQEHRYSRAVPALEKHLLRYVIRRIERQLRAAEHGTLARRHFVPEDRDRRGKAGEPVERLSVRLPPAKPAGRTDAGQRDFAQPAAVQLEHLDPRRSVLQVGHKKAVPDDARAADHLLRLGDHFFPIRSFRAFDVDRDHAPQRGIQVGQQPEQRTLIAEELVLGVEPAQQLDHLGLRICQRLVEHLVLWLGAPPHADHQVLAIVGHPAAESPFLLIRPLVDQPVLVLGIAEPVIEQLLKVVGACELLPRRRFVVAAVEKALIVRRPGHARKLDPLQMVALVLAAGHVPDMPLAPIRPCRGQPVSQQAAIVADLPARQGDRPVLGQPVRVQQLARRPVQGFGHVQDALVLKPVVARVEVPSAALHRFRVTFEIPEFRQPLPDRFPLRNLAQEIESHGILRLDPGFGRFAVHVFEPAVRILDHHAVIVVGLIGPVRFGIGQPQTVRLGCPGGQRNQCHAQHPVRL